MPHREQRAARQRLRELYAKVMTPGSRNAQDGAALALAMLGQLPALLEAADERDRLRKALLVIQRTARGAPTFEDRSKLATILRTASDALEPGHGA
jgi:hypothetical protein